MFYKSLFLGYYDQIERDPQAYDYLLKRELSFFDKIIAVYGAEIIQNLIRHVQIEENLKRLEENFLGFSAA